MGSVGGQLGQLILLLSTALTGFKDKTEKFFNKQDIQIFLVQYLANNMKNDKFILFINRACDKFFKENDIQVS